MQVSVRDGGTMELVNSGVVFPHFLVMSNELSTPKMLICPEEPDRRRISATTFDSTIPAGVANQIPFTNDNRVSYFIGVDADEKYPSMLLCGDRNLSVDGVGARHGLNSVWTNSAVAWSDSRHANACNIGMADGSVQQPSTAALRPLLTQTGVATNRLAFP